MNWYWIILIIFGYLVMGSIIVGLAKRTDDGHVLDNSYGLMLIIDILWPISLVVFILVSIYYLVAYSGKNTTKKESKNKMNEL